MKRLLLPGIALALVVTACGAGTKPALRAVDVALHLRQPSVKAVAAARRREAGRKAAKLLNRVVLPPGARRTQQPAAVEVLSRSGLGTSVITEFAERHGFWRVPAPLSQVVAFVKAHSLQGFDQASSSESVGGERPAYRSLDYYGRLAHGRPMQRLFTITAVALEGATVVRVDAGAAWIYPRSAREVVPAGVHEIDIRDERIARRVTDQAKVTRIVRWFDALNVSPPGVHVECMPIIASKATFVFRSASGLKLATAIVPSQPADGCGAIAFSIRGHAQAPLIDRLFGRHAFVNRVQRVLGLRLPSR
jgi:hypothetical protein